MKQLIITIVSLLLTLPLFADIGVRLGTAAGMQGDIVEASLYADGTLTGQNVVSFQFQITYNQNLVELLDVTNGSVLAAASNPVWQINQASPNYVSITNAFGSALTGTGELLKLKFRLLSGGSSDLTFRGNATNNYFNEGQPAMTFTNGKITITALPTITVNIPSNTSPMAAGTTVNLTASGGTAPYTWAVTDNTLASISATGQLTANNIGTVNARATDSKGYSGLSASIEIRGYRLTINDTAFYQNQYVEIPVSFQNLVNKKVVSGEFSLDYNPSILNFDSLITENQIIGSNGNAFDSHVSAPSSTVQRLRISFASSAGFSASGVLAKIRFKIADATSGSTSLTFSSVQFNDGEQAIVRNATFRINALPPLTVSPAVSFEQYAGETRQLSVSGGTAPYVWTSSKPSVASVDNNGLVSILKGGDATIRVSDVWGAYKTVTFKTYDTKIKAADTLGLVVHRTFRLPIKMTMPVAAALNFTALQGKIVCNAPQIAGISIAVDSSLMANYATAQRYADKVCSFAISGTQAITQTGVLFYAVVEFNETVRQGDSFNISLSDIIMNEGSPNAVIEGGTLKVNVQQGAVVIQGGTSDENSGMVKFNLETQTTMTFTGTVKLTLPPGFTLDEAGTMLNTILKDVISLTIEDLGNNTWLFTFTMKVPGKSAAAQSAAQQLADLEAYTNLFNVFYRVDPAITSGTYQLLFHNIQLTFEDNSQLIENEIPVTVELNYTGINAVPQANSLKAWVENGALHVSGLSAGKPWGVYNIAGVHLTPASFKGGGVATMSLPSHGVYIVKQGNNAVKVVY